MTFRTRNNPRPYVLTQQQVDLIGIDAIRNIIGDEAVVEIQGDSES